MALGSQGEGAGVDDGASDARVAAAEEAAADVEGVTMVALFLGKAGCYDAAVAMLQVQYSIHYTLHSYTILIHHLQQQLTRISSNTRATAAAVAAAAAREGIATETETARIRARCLHALAEVISEREQVRPPTPTHPHTHTHNPMHMHSQPDALTHVYRDTDTHSYAQGMSRWDEGQFLQAWEHLEGAVSIWRSEMHHGSTEGAGQAGVGSARVAKKHAKTHASTARKGDDEAMATLAACLATQAYCGHCVRSVDLHDKALAAAREAVEIYERMNHEELGVALNRLGEWAPSAVSAVSADSVLDPYIA
jgi:hypothetical protein